MTETTRSAALALADERALMRQGYRFLDEKRMLFAAEMLRRLAEYGQLEAQLHEALHAAQAALRLALRRHGIEGLQVYPPVGPAPEPAAPTRSLFLGVPLLAVASAAPAPAAPAAPAAPDAIDASPEAEACRAAFAALLGPLLQLAVEGGNLERLGAEYRRTERRARALENVLLPEIEAALVRIEDHLERADQEEAVRIHLAARRR
jgi:V/A-type H+/Na+-transporting ATPase subunit D